MDYAKVLYFGGGAESEENQWDWTRKVTEGMQATRVFSSADPLVCFDKRPEFYDGYSLLYLPPQRCYLNHHFVTLKR